ncbi:TPA: DNA primase [Candidatus Latescibacteria bacterium]|nr:DNA primase [Candidatus Latescibacterota bacterium]
MRFLKRPSEASDEEDRDEEGEDDIMMEADDGEGFPEADDDEVEDFPEPEASPEPKEVEAVEPE